MTFSFLALLNSSHSIFNYCEKNKNSQILWSRGPFICGKSSWRDSDPFRGGLWGLFNFEVGEEFGPIIISSASTASSE